MTSNYEKDTSVKVDSFARDSINVRVWAHDSLEENKAIEKDIIRIVYDTDKIDSMGNCPVREVIVDRSRINTNSVSTKDQVGEENRVFEVERIDSVKTTAKQAKVTVSKRRGYIVSLFVITLCILGILVIKKVLRFLDV